MGADEDFEAYVSARWATMVRTGILLGCEPHEAEDLAQTALMRCFASWDRVRQARDRDAYVYRVLVNCLADNRRRRWRAERPTAAVPEQAAERDETADVDMAEAVGRALARLGPDGRAVVVLRFYVHLGQDQTAQALGIPTGTVKSRLSRALAQLADDGTLAEHRQRRTP